MLKLEEACNKKDKHIHVLEIKIEHCKETIDRYANIVKLLQIKVCHCNDNVAKTASGSEEREESSELEYASESSEEGEYKMPPPDLMTVVIEGCTLRGMFPVTINLTMMTDNMLREYSTLSLFNN